MSTPKAFVASIDDWVRKSEARMLAVFRGSAQEVLNRAQGRVPVDTGYCRSTVTASKSQPPGIDPSSRPVKGQKYNTEGPTTVAILEIAGTQLGERIYIGWSCSYAAVLESGHSMQAPAGFVGITAMEWPQIVAEQVTKAKAAVAANTGN